MSKQDNPGIDYGLGRSNIDLRTGIRYGVINMNALGCWAWESFESDYGEPTCPRCGNPACDYSDLEDDSGYDNYRGHCCAEYACESCKLILDSEDVYAEEPLGWELEDEGYHAIVDFQGDVMLLRSPYYTHAQYCSPCVPGAGHLENPCPRGPKTYAFAADWFDEDRPCPYPVYRVSDDQLLYTPES